MVQTAALVFLMAVQLVVVPVAHTVPRAEVEDAATCNTTCMLQTTSKNGQAGSSTDDGKSSEPRAARTIFTYWDYPHGINPLVELNIMSWLSHAPPGTELVRINDTNFRSFVPDAPDEIFRLPYPAVKSDIVRAAVLYHHGGLYMDTDFVVMKDLSSVFAKLDEGWDVVAYSDNGGVPSGQCRDHYFSSNFMAARKGNVVSGTWWENIKAKLTRMCGPEDLVENKVCCHIAWMDEQPKYCNVPWGFLEWLKAPENDPDIHSTKSPLDGVPSKSHSPEDAKIVEAIELGNRKAKALPEDARIFCYQGNESLTPHLNGEVYWQKWDFATQATATDVPQTQEFDDRFQCRDENGDLVCDKGQWGEGLRVFPDFWGRIAYHLFFSTGKRLKETKEEMLDSSWMVAELYHRSLGKDLSAAVRET